MRRPYEVCGDEFPKPFPNPLSLPVKLLCILEVGHYGMHQNGDGALWSVDPDDKPLCPATSRSLPTTGGDWACVLNEGHAGHHSTKEGHHWHGWPPKERYGV